MNNRLNKISGMIGELALAMVDFTKAGDLAQKSLLKEVPALRDCALCGAGGLQDFIRFPLGWPMPQRDHLLYYDYARTDFTGILENKELLFRTAGFFLGVRWDFCPHCRNLSLAVKFSDEHIHDYYARYYQRLAPSSPRRRNTKEHYARFADSLVPRGAQLLELGAAEGYAADYLANAGHRVYVVEPSVLRSSVSQSGNITLIPDIEGQDKESFDLIYLHHVLEHFNDPAAFLAKASQLLRKNGKLMIQVPDISLQIRAYLKSLRWCHYALFNPVRCDRKAVDEYFPGEPRPYYWMDALGNNHLYAFSPFGLRYLLEKSGFKIGYLKQTRKDDLLFDKNSLMWPLDRENGQTPNGLTIVARR
jgi:SAM-dependent methyltransferase